MIMVIVQSAKDIPDPINRLVVEYGRRLTAIKIINIIRFVKNAKRPQIAPFR